jgi:arylsulfatase A-like enzyme
VPFVVSWPAKLKPGKFDQPVTSLDVFPTAVLAAGAEIPKGVPLDGVDLIPRLRGESKEADRALYWRAGGGQDFAARRGSMKLVLLGEKAPELYDLAADIGETTNLAEKKPTVVSALSNDLKAWNTGLVKPRWQNPKAAKKKPN